VSKRSDGLTYLITDSNNKAETSNAIDEPTKARPGKKQNKKLNICCLFSIPHVALSRV
jgi:hypothetical protein